MAKWKIWTAEELEKLTPDQRHKLFNDAVITDLSTADPELVAWARAKSREALERHGVIEKLNE